MYRKSLYFILVLTLSIFLITACENNSDSSDTTPSSETTIETTVEFENIKEATPQSENTNEIIEGEFVAINDYRITSIEYYRGILIDGDELLLLSGGTTPYTTGYNLDTGLKSIISFYVGDISISSYIDSGEYVYTTGLEEIYLPEAKKNIFLGKTGINIRIEGKRVTTANGILTGLTIFEVDKCEIIQ